MLKNLHDIDIKLLRVFRVVAKEQSFTAAAEQLNTSLPNISMMMTQLESRLNMRLCERGVKGFRLTNQGQRVLIASNGLYDSINDFQTEVKSIAEGMQCEFRIGMVTEMLIENKICISNILADIEESLPDSYFHMDFELAANLKAKVESDELHCAFAHFVNIPASLESRYIYSERLLCYYSNQHELFNIPNDDIKLQQLKNYKVAGYDHLADEEQRLLPFFSKYDSCSKTSEGILALVLTGNYIGILPESFAKNWQDKGLIHAIDHKELELGLVVDLIYKAARIEETPLKALLASVEKHYPKS